jgi:protoheme IX farnesyltransferase
MAVAWNRTLIQFNAAVLMIAVAAITLASAGCDALTSYIDRDIDAVMNRTKRRPIPSGRVSATGALVWGLILSGGGMLLALSINFLSFLWITLGVLDNVVVYSLLLKRRSPTNIILGGVSGGLPVLFGWSAIANNITLLPVLLAALVVLWIPGHIWSLAIFTKTDYRRAHVPMLPVVTNLKTALRCIVSTVVLMIPFSLWIYFEGSFGLIYLTVALAFGVAVLYINFQLFLHPTNRMAYSAFKISSPYLFTLFLAMILDSIVKLH